MSLFGGMEHRQDTQILALNMVLDRWAMWGNYPTLFWRREMKTERFVRGVVVSMAVLGMCLPQVAFAVEPASTPAILDVALSDGGALQGKVVDLQGSGVAGVPVSVKIQDRNVATATTAADGTFRIQGLRGGVYQVAAGQGQAVYRLWSAGTAPPVAQTSAVVYTQNGVVDSDVVVYTAGGGTLKMLLSNPIVIAGLVVTAIAVPVALANSRSSSP